MDQSLVQPAVVVVVVVTFVLLVLASTYSLRLMLLLTIDQILAIRTIMMQDYFRVFILNLLNMTNALF